MEIHINHFGVIPKGHQTGKWRFTVDLSHPEGHRVNDGIDPALCSLSYTTVEIAAQRVNALGKGTLLAKIDSESDTAWSLSTLMTGSCQAWSGKKHHRPSFGYLVKVKGTSNSPPQCISPEARGVYLGEELGGRASNPAKSRSFNFEGLPPPKHHPTALLL